MNIITETFLFCNSFPPSKSADLLEDPTDYRQKLREATEQAEKEHCVQMVALKRLSVTANENLDQVFKAITK